MSKIHDSSLGYSIIRLIADTFIHHSFRRYKVIGMENIPESGAVIFAPNHCDALMDPLAVLALTWEKKVFIARADVFNNPFFQKVLTYFKIMPINRRRDGIRSVIKTEETIKNSIEVLNKKVKFCILPEGTHRDKHSLLPIGKGIARIACGACHGLGDTPLYIVPIGLDYGDYYRYRSSLLVQVGEPINITQYLKDSADKSEHTQMQEIKEMVGDALRNVLVYVKDDENYEGTWELAKIASGHIPPHNLEGRYEANRKVIAKIEKLKEERPEKAAELLEKAVAFARARRKSRISINATHKERKALNVLLLTLKALILLPVFIASLAVSFPQIILMEKIATGVKDKAFRNSLRCALMLLVWSLLILAWAIFLFCKIPWYMAVVAIALIVPAPLHCYDYFETARQTASAWRYLFNGRLAAMRRSIENDLKNNNII